MSGVQVVDLRNGGGGTTTIPSNVQIRQRRNSLKKKRPPVYQSRTRSSEHVPFVQAAAPPPVSILQRPPGSNTYTVTNYNAAPATTASTSHHHTSAYPGPGTGTHSTAAREYVATREQVVYVASGQPIIIVDERKNKNTPLPTIIRDGQVVVGPSTTTPPSESHPIAPGVQYHTASSWKTSPQYIQPSQHTQVQNVVANPPHTYTSQYNEGHSSHLPQPQQHNVIVEHRDAPSGGEKGLLSRGSTWGHSHKRAPPWMHPDHRCRSNYHGLKEWWMGVMTMAKDRRATGNTLRDESRRERESERRNRWERYRQNVRDMKFGRRDVPIEY